VCAKMRYAQRRRACARSAMRRQPAAAFDDMLMRVTARVLCHAATLCLQQRCRARVVASHCRCRYRLYAAASFAAMMLPLARCLQLHFRILLPLPASFRCRHAVTLLFFFKTRREWKRARRRQRRARERVTRTQRPRDVAMRYTSVAARHAQAGARCACKHSPADARCTMRDDVDALR